ncbi:MAG TPA: hypothetical protein VG245_11640 [Candidatus Dormibacteraeota bacterium]|jgi:hypothetical protein|nr:hypothetical protein [Candidatus Dormibacteraeota bacterium]
MSKRSGLRLSRETVRNLDATELGSAAGGVSITCFAGCTLPTVVIVSIQVTTHATDHSNADCAYTKHC